MGEVEPWVSELNDEPEAPAGSPLAALRNRVDAARKSRVIDLEVPFADDGPPVFVRFGPLAADKLEGIRKRRAKAGDEQMILQAADTLIATVIGVFVDMPDAPEPVEVAKGFTPDLAAELGTDATRAVDVVRALYPTDGDVIGASERVIRFSGFMGDDVEEHTRKN